MESIYDILSRYYEALKQISEMSTGFNCYEERQDQCCLMKSIALKAIEPVDEVTVVSPIYHLMENTGHEILAPMTLTGHMCTCMPGHEDECPYCNPKEK